MIGHNDIAPGRKSDPGPLFPWKKLAAHGVGAWPDMKTVDAIEKQLSDEIDIGILQESLKVYGFPIQLSNRLDQQTKDVITTFNRHFLSLDSDIPSPKMRATLAALLKKYFPHQALAYQTPPPQKVAEEDTYVWVKHADIPTAPTLFKPTSQSTEKQPKLCEHSELIKPPSH